MDSLVDALAYVKATGYVPWGTPSERGLTEQLQTHSLIEFEPETRREHRFKKFRWKRDGRYFLTAEGRKLLRAQQGQEPNDDG